MNNEEYLVYANTVSVRLNLVSSFRGQTEIEITYVLPNNGDLHGDTPFGGFEPINYIKRQHDRIKELEEFIDSYLGDIPPEKEN